MTRLSWPGAGTKDFRGNERQESDGGNKSEPMNRWTLDEEAQDQTWPREQTFPLLLYMHLLFFFFYSCKIIWKPPRQQEAAAAGEFLCRQVNFFCCCNKPVASAAGQSERRFLFPAAGDDGGFSFPWICTAWTVTRRKRSDLWLFYLFVFKVLFIVFLNRLQFFHFKSFWIVVRCIFLLSYFRFLDSFLRIYLSLLVQKNMTNKRKIKFHQWHLLNVNLSIFFKRLLYNFYFSDKTDDEEIRKARKDFESVMVYFSASFLCWHLSFLPPSLVLFSNHMLTGRCLLTDKRDHMHFHLEMIGSTNCFLYFS